MRWIDREEVAERLTYEVCLPIVREAMIAFSRGETLQLLRSILPLGEGRMFGVMPGAMGAKACFGAKLISVFPENFAKGVQSHQGVVVLFDPESGAPVCLVHAGEVTAIRTAAASAVATDALARKDARRMVLLGRFPGCARWKRLLFGAGRWRGRGRLLSRWGRSWAWRCGRSRQRARRWRKRMWCAR